MQSDSQPTSIAQASRKAISLKIVAVGGAGIQVMNRITPGTLEGATFAAVNTDPGSLAACGAAETLHLETRLLRGLGSGGDPERGRALAEEHIPRLKELCEGVDAVFILAGLGGGAGTGISPVLARAAKEAGTLVLGFVTTPFECEGSRRQRIARDGLQSLKAAADGVICMPNQKVFKLIDENTTLLDTFNITNDFLAEGVRGLWRLLTHSGLIEIHFDDLAALLRDRHAESAFAVAEALGPTRSREVTDKLLAHPMLDGGQALAETDAVLISLVGGPDLTMAEVNRVMAQLNRHCEQAQVLMGAAVAESFRDRLAVTLIATRKNCAPMECEPRSTATAENLGQQLLDPAATPRPCSRFLPPPPALPQQRMEEMLSRQRRTASNPLKNSLKLLQTQLPLEIVSKGRFDKSEPTIHKGEDLDVPTYIRRGVALN